MAKSTKSRFLLLGMSAQNPNDGGFESPSYCVVELDKRYLQTLLDRHQVFMQAHKQSDSLWESYYWDGSPTVYDAVVDEIHDAMPDAVREDNYGEGFYLADASPFPDGTESARIEVPQLVVREENVHWVFMPKHGDSYYQTASVPVDKLKEWLCSSTKSTAPTKRRLAAKKRHS